MSQLERNAISNRPAAAGTEPGPDQDQARTRPGLSTRHRATPRATTSLPPPFPLPVSANAISEILTQKAEQEKRERERTAREASLIKTGKRHEAKKVA